MSDSDLERRVLELYERLLAVSEAARDAWLDTETANDPALRARVDAMRRAARAAALQTGSALDQLNEDIVPETVGAYRIVRSLGRGGMGAVYLAERLAGDFDHQVAIKIIKTGLFSETLIERFRRERQTLARLNHPHIARLYDGGEMPNGAPYLVMEYVVGQTLSEWIAANQPDRATRQRLFLQICEAVEYAHQNLVIHRDLTPSNILVTDGGDAKVIDFGIARPHVAAEDGAATSTFAGLSLTPGFAAPERLAGIEANTLVDIFSLGKILSLLLIDASHPELDAVAARAQANDPNDRYPTVASMALDVANWEQGLPVGAYSTARWYRFKKAAQREKLLFASVAAFSVALLGGLVATGWAYTQAEHERVLADQRFSQIRALAGFQLFDLYDRLDNVIGNVEARVALAREAQRYLAILARDPDADAALKLETARGFIKLALIQGVSARPNLGEHDQALANLAEAQRLLGSLSQLPIAVTAPYLARVHAYRALLLTHAKSKPQDARSEIDHCTRALESVATRDRGSDFMLARSDCRLSLLEWLDVEARTEELDAAAIAFLADIDEWPVAMQQSPRADFDRALAMHFRASVGYSSSDAAARRTGLERNLAAERLFADLERRFPNDPLYLYRRAYNAYYGHAAASQLEQDEVAQSFLSQARNTVGRLLLIDSRDESLVTFEERLREAQADFYAVKGRFNQAIAMQQTVIDGRAALVAESRASNRLSDLGYGYAILGVIARRANRRDLACSSWTVAEQHLREVASRGDLRGYVAEMRGGIQRNIARCERGEPVSAFEALNE
jgi:eukaryotic-like serine/threonine-protein kinase